MGARTWTPTDIAQLKLDWAAGKSGGTIARLTGRSRSAIMGKINRLGLDSRRTLDAIYHTNLSVARAAKQKAARALREPPACKPRPQLKTFPLPTPEPPPANPIALIDLRSCHCRWIAGEPKDGLYCGRQVANGFPFCAHHAAKCYVMPRR